MHRRLLLVLIAPLLALTLLGYELSMTAHERWVESQVSSHVANVVVQVTRVDEALGAETLIGASPMGDEQLDMSDSLAAATATTDEELAALVSSVDPDIAGASGFGDVIDQVRTVLSYRSDVLEGVVTPLQIADRYAIARAGMLDGIVAYGTSATEEDSGDIVALVSMITARSAHLDERLAVDLRLRFGEFAPGQAEGVAAAVRVQEDLAELSAALVDEIPPRPTDELQQARRELTANLGETQLTRDEWRRLSDEWLAQLNRAVESEVAALTARVEAEARSAKAARLTTIIGAAAAVGIAILTAALLSFQLVRRMRRISTAAAQLSVTGAAAVKVDDQGADEIAELARSFDKMSARIQRASATRDVEAAVLESIANDRPLADTLDLCNSLLAPGWKLELEPAAETSLPSDHPDLLVRDRTGRTRPVNTEIDDAGSAEHRLGCSLARLAHRRSSDLGRLHHRATFDALTGLLNRESVLSDLGDACLSRGTGVLYIDLDDFKLVNDGLGHESGDRVLRSVSQALVAVVDRWSGVTGRLGGDEFLVVLRNVASEQQLRTIAEQLATAVRQATVGFSARVTASIGGTLSEGFVEPSHLLAEADAAMYAAKNSQQDGIMIADAGFREELSRLRDLEYQLIEAIEDRSFDVHYQSIHAPDGATLVGLEALGRWTANNGTRVPPGTFFELAEKLGVAPAIDQIVLEKALDQVRHWRAAGLIVPPVNVNASAQTLARPHFVREVLDRISHAGVRPDAIVVEVTESALITDLDIVGQRLDELRSKGVRIAVDDFGSGYSSLSYLSSLPIDIIKIDRQFISHIDSDRSNHAIVRAITELARAVGMDVVAEGIERESERDALAEIGQISLQGFLFSRPTDAHSLRHLLAAHTRRKTAPDLDLTVQR